MTPRLKSGSGGRKLTPGATLNCQVSLACQLSGRLSEPTMLRVNTLLPESLKMLGLALSPLSEKESSPPLPTSQASSDPLTDQFQSL